MSDDIAKLLGSATDFGAIRVQLDEVIREKHRTAEQVTHIALAMARLENVPSKFDRMESRLDTRLEKIETRLSILETSDSNRKVVTNVWLEVVKSPAMGWVVGVIGAVITFIAYARGK